jgi:hypothetical protein
MQSETPTIGCRIIEKSCKYIMYVITHFPPEIQVKTLELSGPSSKKYEEIAKWAFGPGRIRMYSPESVKAISFSESSGSLASHEGAEPCNGRSANAEPDFGLLRSPEGAEFGHAGDIFYWKTKDVFVTTREMGYGKFGGVIPPILERIGLDFDYDNMESLINEHWYPIENIIEMHRLRLISEHLDIPVKYFERVQV